VRRSVPSAEEPVASSWAAELERGSAPVPEAVDGSWAARLFECSVERWPVPGFLRRCCDRRHLHKPPSPSSLPQHLPTKLISLLVVPFLIVNSYSCTHT
jgi:hypothetical protein